MFSSFIPSFKTPDPPSPPPTLDNSSPIVPEQNKGSILTQGPAISSRLFGHRNCPSYLDNTTIEGSSTKDSVLHWIEVIELWEEDIQLPFPIKVKKEHLTQLKETLKNYLITLERYQKIHNNRGSKKGLSLTDFRKMAKKTLSEIKAGLATQPNWYTPLGYCSSTSHSGHMITTKIRWLKDTVEILFLNLGEGAGWHPELNWSESGPRYHFQSFPVHIKPEVLFGEKGELLFARLIQLYIEPADAQVSSYDAMDIYGGFWLLGEVQSSFESKPELRANKPQLNSNCSDMAALLLIKDLLIDLGYSKKDIQRFFCNELLGNLGAFYNDLAKSDTSRDSWLLLKCGLENFTIHILHLCRNTLSENEVISCKHQLLELFDNANRALAQFKTPIDSLPAELNEESHFVFDQKICCESLKATEQISYQITNQRFTLPLSPPILPSTDSLLETLAEWKAAAQALYNSGQKARAMQFVFRMMMTLPIPDPENPGYWDEVLEDQRAAIVDNLSALVLCGADTDFQHFYYHYRSILIMHTAYAIVDKLARLNVSMQLEGFSSPFFPSGRQLNAVNGIFNRLEIFLRDKLGFSDSSKEDGAFEFLFLPLESFNSKWADIVKYFEHPAKTQLTPLFAVGEGRVDIERAAREIFKVLPFAPLSPTAQHVTYLQQFSKEKENTTFFVSEIEDLWINKKQRLPPEYNHLYFFAYYCWAFFTVGRGLIFPPNRANQTLLEKESDSSLVLSRILPISYDHYDMRCGPSLRCLGRYEDHFYSILSFRRRFRKLHENATLCANEDRDCNFIRQKHLREWGRIFATPSLQITSTLLWVKQNYHEMEHSFFQGLVEAALFEPGRLKKKLKKQPEIGNQIKELAKEGIEFFRRADKSNAFYFFLYLGICNESFSPQPDLRHFEDIILSQIPEEDNPWILYSYLQLLYQIDLPRGKESLKELIKAQFWIAFFAKKNDDCLDGELKYNDYPNFLSWIWTQIEYSVDRYQSLVKEAFQDEAWVVTIAQELLTLLKLPHNEKLTIEADYPLLKAGPFIFQIEQTTVSNGSSEELVPIKRNKKHELIWFSEESFLSFDGKDRFSKTGDTYILARLFNPDGAQAAWYDKIKLLDDSTQTHFLFKEREVWVKSDSRDEFLLTADGEDTLRITRSGAVQKLTSSGPLHLLDWRQSKELSSFVLDSGLYEDVFFWSLPDSTKIHEMEIRGLNLSFRGEEYKGEWRLRSVEYPNFFLAKTHELEALNHFKGAIKLETTDAKAVILPKGALQKREGDFTTEVTLSDDKLEEGIFFYQVDEITNLLVSHDSHGNLYLSVFFAMQRDYKKALHYLSRGSNFISFEDCLFIQRLTEAVFNLQDRSPEALAYYLRFGLLVVENGRQLLREGFGTENHKNHPISENFLTRLSDHYEQYLQVLSCKLESKVPGYIRLTYEEERLLLDCFNGSLQATRKDEKEKRGAEGLALELLRKIKGYDYWKPAFEVREKLLNSQGRSLLYNTPIAPYTSIPLEYQIVPFINDGGINYHFPNFKEQKSPLPPYVRLNYEEQCEYFVCLYESAKKRGDFDAELNIFYLLKSPGVIERKTSRFYAALLTYVHTYPGRFENLNFGSDPQKNIEIFKQIVKESQSLSALISKVGTVAANYWKKSIIFYYQRAAELKLPQPLQLKPQSWGFSEEKLSDLERVKEGLFNFFLNNGLLIEQRPCQTSERPFCFGNLRTRYLTPCENRVVADLSLGHKKLLAQEEGPYTFRLKEETGTVLKKAKKYQRFLISQLQRLKQESEALANFDDGIDFRIGLRKKSRDLPEITVEGLLSDGYSHKDPMIIKRANPALDASRIQQALFKTIEYHLLRIQLHQLERGIAALKAENIQGFGEAIAPYAKSHPAQEPEVTLFQSRTGKAIQEKQADILDWHFKTKKRFTLFAAPAGGGKTTIFQPIAMSRSKRQGAIPFSVSPQSLYVVDRDGLKFSSQQAHHMDIAVMEISLNVELLASDYRRIYEELYRFSGEKGLKIVPEAYYALDLKYKLLLEKGTDLESIKWASLILDLLAQKGVAFVDEARINLSPLSQAKIGIGRPKPLPKLDRVVFLTIYRCLVNPELYIEDGRSVEKVLLLLDNLQAAVSESDYKLAKETVLKELLKHPLFCVAEEREASLLKYWLSQAEEPIWMEGLEKRKQEAIQIAKIYFDFFYKSSMQMIGRIKHARSLKASEEIHVPARQGRVLDAYFEQAHVTLIATMQGTLQEGLDETQIKELIKLLYQEHGKLTGFSHSTSAIEQMFQTWMDDSTIYLRDFLSPTKIQTQMLCAKLKDKVPAIFWYLEKKVFEQITYAPYQLVVTPFHFIHAFSRSVLFSADPGLKEIYAPPGQISFKSDKQFLAQVVHRMADPSNTEILVFPQFNRPLELFRWLLVNSPKIFDNLSMLADSGLLRDFSCSEIADDFFLFLEETQLPYDGVILFEEKQAEEGALLLRLRGGKQNLLKGHDIIESLAALGLDWEKLKLLTLIDPSHTTGANIKQKAGSCALVLLSEDFALGQGVQTTMRMRDFLTTQHVAWGLHDLLKKQIEAQLNHVINPEVLRVWMLMNEGKKMEQEIPLSAFQQIAYYVEKPAWDEVRSQHNDPKKEIAVWQKHRSGFIKQTEANLIKRFRQDAKPQSARTVLINFAQELYNSFGYTLPWGLAKQVKNNVNEVIMWVEKIMPEFRNQSAQNLTQHTHMHLNQKQQVEIEQVSRAREDLVPCWPEPLPDMSIQSKYFTTLMKEMSSPAAEVFGSAHLTPGLWFTHNLLKTASSGGVELNEDYLKPTQYILLLLTDKKWMAFALSDYEAAILQKRLDAEETGTRKAALISGDGEIVQNGKGACALSNEELQSAFVRDVVIDIGLTQCKINHTDRLIQRLATWDDFCPMWEKIKLCQIWPTETYPGAVERLIPQNLKNFSKQPKEEPSKLKSFFSWFA